MENIVKVTRITTEEAEAFRTRARKQREEMGAMVVISVDDFLAVADDIEFAAYDRGVNNERMNQYYMPT